MALHASEILQPLQLLKKEVEFGRKIERNFAFVFVSIEQIKKYTNSEHLSVICARWKQEM